MWLILHSGIKGKWADEMTGSSDLSSLCLRIFAINGSATVMVTCGAYHKAHYLCFLSLDTIKNTELKDNENYPTSNFESELLDIANFIYR